MRLTPNSESLREYNSCHAPADGKFCSTKGIGSPAFKAWFGKSQVVDEAGQPLRVYHGTVTDFDEFDPSKGNIESDFGAGIYFSNTMEDVGVNYAGIGPDLENKIEQEAERIQQELEDEGYEDTRTVRDPSAREEAIRRARQQLVAHGGASLPVYLRIENPAILGGVGETTLTMDYGEEDDSEPTGTLVDFIGALRHVASRYDEGDVEDAVSVLFDYGSDGITLAKTIEYIRKSERFSYYTDSDSGKLVSNEILRQALEDMGFDGIIDRTVDVKFGSRRRVGRRMEGVHEGTVHYVAFRPEQIKSAIGNRGTWSRRSRKITEGRR